MLVFDEATHTYLWDGQLVPGVTSVLKPISGYGSVPQGVLDVASERGRAVHLACQLYDEGDLDEQQLDPMLRPYLDAWAQFMADHDCSWSVIEQPMFHPTLRYAGTADRIGLVKGRLAVLDIKTTAQLQPTNGPQLAAYARLHTQAPIDRWVAQLKADGTYVLQPYSSPSDWPLFCSLLTVRNWCAAHRITPAFSQE